MYTFEKFEEVLEELKTSTSGSGPEIVAKINFITSFVNAEIERKKHAQSLVLKERQLNQSLKHLNTKFLAELKQKRQLSVELLEIKQHLQQQNSEIENQKLRFSKEKLQAESETKRLQEQHSGELAEMRRAALYAVRWQSNIKARKQQQLFRSHVKNLKHENAILVKQIESLKGKHVGNVNIISPPIIPLAASASASSLPLPSINLKTLLLSYSAYETCIAPGLNIPLKYRPVAWTLNRIKKRGCVKTKPRVPDGLRPSNKVNTTDAHISVPSQQQAMPVSVPVFHVES